MAGVPWQTIRLPKEAAAILSEAPSVLMVGSLKELIQLSVRDAKPDGIQEVSYDIPGKGRVVEATVSRVLDGISANYPDPYMRMGDPDCVVVVDQQTTSKKRYRDRFGAEFHSVRQKTFDWLRGQELVVFPFAAGAGGKTIDAIAICPANAGFFALRLASLQGILDSQDVPDNFAPKVVVYIAPPFRHTYFQGRQVVVHNRCETLHELFSYNLSPGDSGSVQVFAQLMAAD